MKTVQILDVKVNAEWLSGLFKEMALYDSEVEHIEGDKESYVKGRIDSLYDSLQDESFAFQIREFAYEDKQICQVEEIELWKWTDNGEIKVSLNKKIIEAYVAMKFGETMTLESFIENEYNSTHIYEIEAMIDFVRKEKCWK